LNVQVPFLFKLGVDWLNTATGNASVVASNPTMMALFATPMAVLIGYGIARSGASAFNGIYK
jgi:ATP-binding cassette, subfamily B (MDR/TAP), member 7